MSVIPVTDLHKEASPTYLLAFFSARGELMTITKYLRQALLSLAISLFATIAFAAPKVSLDIIAEKDVVEVNDKGEHVTRRVETSDTLPGDILFYTIRYNNSGDESARSVQLDNPIPAGTTYIDGSAWGDIADISFSIDSGKSFKKPANLTNQITRDGKQEDRQAIPEQYNAIRWLISEIPAGSKGITGFSVIVQ